MLDGFSYEVDSPLKAVDIVFKACHALHVDYPHEAQKVFAFLPHYVYKFSTSHNVHCASARQIGDKYEAFKKELKKI